MHSYYSTSYARNVSATSMFSKANFVTKFIIINTKFIQLLNLEKLTKYIVVIFFEEMVRPMTIIIIGKTYIIKFLGVKLNQLMPCRGL